MGCCQPEHWQAVRTMGSSGSADSPFSNRTYQEAAGQVTPSLGDVPRGTGQWLLPLALQNNADAAWMDTLEMGNKRNQGTLGARRLAMQVAECLKNVLTSKQVLKPCRQHLLFFSWRIVYALDHDNGFFQIGANVFRTFFDAVRVAELMDAEISGGAVKALEGTGG